MSGGYLVTIEGIDGSGKSTVVDALQAADFTDIVSDVTFTREPTTTQTGELLREILAEDNSDVFSELFLFMADHSSHLSETVWPALNRDELVICDRYIDSRCAYQGHTLDGVVENPVEYVYQLHQPWSRIPDCTILLELDPETAAGRTSSGEKYETSERLTEIRENYHTLRDGDSDRFKTVDASQSPEEVLEDVETAIKESYTAAVTA